MRKRGIKLMLRKDIVLREVKRFRWLAQQCESESEKAFYLGAAFALDQSVGYSTRDQNRIELAYERDFNPNESADEILWNLAVDGDPFPVSEEKWMELHPGKTPVGLKNEAPSDSEITPKRSNRHDRIFY